MIALTAPTASTIPPETMRFLRRVSEAEVSMRMFLMAVGIRLGWIERMSAMSPVMCGAAIEVPSIQPYPPSGRVERMSLPGATTSTLCRP